MAEGQIQTWQEQLCGHCGWDTFVTLVKLRAKAGGGFITMPGGYACQKCGDKADVAQMQRAALRKERMQELQVLEAEMADLHPAPAAESGTG